MHAGKPDVLNYQYCNNNDAYQDDDHCIQDNREFRDLNICRSGFCYGALLTDRPFFIAFGTGKLAGKVDRSPYSAIVAGL